MYTILGLLLTENGALGGLGASPFVYAPYAFVCWLTLIIAGIFGYTVIIGLLLTLYSFITEGEWISPIHVYIPKKGSSLVFIAWSCFLL